MTPEFLTLQDRRLAYQRQTGAADKPGVIFLGGYASDMTGTKASFLAQYCAARNISFLRFDYSGHGRSSGDFKDGTIGAWLEDALAVFDQLTNGPQIVIGSSMGGWLALMLAMKRPERVKAFIGIAAAPDFTEDLVWGPLPEAKRHELQRNGFIDDENRTDKDYPITLRLIEEARQHLILRQPITLACPVRLLQGMEDRALPWNTVQRIGAALTGGDVRISLIRYGDHNLTREQDLALLREVMEEFIA